MKQTIGIVGMGMVGGTLKSWFPEAKAWDKYKKSPNTKEEVLEQDIIFLAIYLEDNGLSKKDTDSIYAILDDVPADRGRVIINKPCKLPIYKINNRF